MKILNLDGLRNTRNIGGYVNKDGKTLIEEKFIRSCELSKTTKSTQNILTNQNNVRTIIDFRTDVEVKKKPIPKIENIEIIHLPILEDANLGVPRNFKQIVTMYKNIIRKNVSPDTFLTNMYLNMAFSDYSTQMYRKFFDILLDNPDGTILYNCTEGKDRTGIATMLLLSSLNFDKETVLKDYMLSKNFCDVKMNFYLKRCKRLFISKKITNFVTGIMATKEIFLNAVYNKIESDYKTVENYLKEKINLDDFELEKLKNNFLS